MTGKLKKMAFGIGVLLAVVVLALAVPMTYGAAAISSVVVDVLVPRAGGSVLVVPYVHGTNGVVSSESLTAKVISETDVRKVKGALCRTRVLVGFYNSGIVTFESPTTARAVFWRRNTLLQMSLVKVGSDWKVANVMEGSAHRAVSKDIWNRILDAACQLAP